MKVKLDGKPLPWVDRVDHLGHVLQSDGSMEADACRARASFLSKFVQKLLQSPSKEIRFLSKILINDPRSTIGKNDWFLDNLTNVSIVVTSNSKVKQLIPINPIPANDQWRIRLLQVLLDARKEKNSAKLNLTKDQLNDMLQSLCIS